MWRNKNNDNLLVQNGTNDLCLSIVLSACNSVVIMDIVVIAKTRSPS